MAEPQFKALDVKNLQPRQFQVMVRNIGNVHAQADEATKREGREWYPRAHDIAKQVGNGDLHTGAGVIAALSPGQNWDRNIAQAHQFSHITDEHIRSLQAGDRSILHGTPLDSQTTDNIMKAHKIRQGMAPSEVLPMKVKTGNFYRNIVDPSDKEPVTIDTHAHDIAHGEKLAWATNRGLSSVGRYETFSNAYRTAAKRAGEVTPGTMQAVTWTHWRQVNGGKRVG